MASIRRCSPWRVVVARQTTEAVVYPTRKQANAAAARLTAAGTQDVKVERVPAGSWEVRIRCKLAPELTKSFKLKTEAEQWVRELEGEIAKRQYVDYRQADQKSLCDLLAKYDEIKLSSRPADDPDRTRVRMLRLQPMTLIRMSATLPAGY